MAFPNGSQMTYKLQEDRSLKRFNKQKEEVSIEEQISSLGENLLAARKVGWIFVFETPFHLQKFVRFIREAKGELDNEQKTRNNSNLN